jgi:hypothetical protein
VQCFLALVVLAAIAGFVYLVAKALNAFTNTADDPHELPPRPRGRRAPHDCPGCGEHVRPADFDCPRCGLTLRGPTARRLGRLRTAQDEVRGLSIDGAIDDATAKVVLTQLERRARVLRGIPADTATAPVAEPPLVVAPSPEAAAVTEPVAPPRDETPLADPPAAAADEPPPVEPRRAGGFAAFMEERNILWGELVGGLLIVGCSVALVVTLWQRLEAFPYFPFALSAAVTLALYGAGQYTLHHWRLTGTSRGLLVISLLLAPLNLLLLSDAITRGVPSQQLELGVKLSAVLGFAWVVRGGARDVLSTRPSWRWLLPLAVVGAAATQLLPAQWLARLPTPAPAWLALGCFAAACLLALRGIRDETDLPRDTGPALLAFVGLAAFALAVVWGLHVARPDVAGRVAGLALPLALAGGVVVSTGLLVQRRVFDGAIKTAGLAVALAGFVAMTGGLAAAWPDPLRVLLVSLATGTVLTRVSVRESMPWVHVAAIPALALGAVVGVHGLAGNWEAVPLADYLPSAPSAAVLVGFALLLALLAEVLVGRGDRAPAVSYALGATGVGLVGLFLASVNGLDHPVTAAAVHGASAAGLLAANGRWRLRVIAHGGLWLVLLGSLWTLHAAAPGERSVWGFVVSVEALALALLGLAVKGFPRSATRLLRHAARDAGVAAAVLALALAVSARTPATGWDTGLFLTLGLTGLALARLTGAALATYLGSASVFLGLMHLAVVTSHWEPMRRAVLVGVLAHATLAALGAVVLRHLDRLFARPLRTSVVVASGLAAVLLFVPAAGLAPQWAACAVWLALVWLVVALVWRERSAFLVFQVALSLAAVLGVVARLDVPTTARGYFEPVALHSYSVALALLALGWVLTRRRLRDNTAARELWTDRPWSAERIVLAAVVLGQLAFAAMAVAAEVRAELAPAGWQVVRAVPAVFTLPFGVEAWVALALLTVAVLASWRLTATARDGHAHLAGLMLLFLTVPAVWAKTHAGDVASASALRWGLAAAFAVGTAAVSLRVPLRRGLDRLGFVLESTALTRPVLLGSLAAASAVVVYLSVQVVELGIAGREPSGPVATSVFAAMGRTASTLVPLALVVLGLAGSAGRERSPGYAFAGGLVFVGTIAAGYALDVLTAGGRIDGAERFRIYLLACGGTAVWGAVWLAAERRVTGGVLLAIQSRLGLVGTAMAAALIAVAVIVRPDAQLLARWEEFGRWGGIVLAMAAGVAVWRARRSEPALLFHAVTASALAAGVVAACAAQSWGEAGEWLPFHVLAGAWATAAVGVVIATRARGESSLWFDGLAAVLALLALRAGWHDPWRPWMPAGLAAVAALTVGVAAVLTRGTVRVVASGLLVNAVAVLLWLPTDPQTVSGFLLANAAGLAVAAAIWTNVSLRLNEHRWRPDLDVARGLTLPLLWFGLAPTLAGDRADPVWLVRGATVAVACAMLVALHDARALVARGGLYAAVLALFLLGNIEATTRPLWNHWATPFTLAYHALVVSGFALYIARSRTQPFPIRGDDWGWLVVAQGSVAVIAIVLGVRLGLTEAELRDRLAVSPFSVILLLGSAALLLRAVPVWANLLRFAAVALVVLVLATTAWAVPDPAGLAPWLQRNAWLFVALAVAGVAATELASRVGEHWRRAARSLGGLAAGLAVAALCVNLLQQVPLYDPATKHTPLEPAAVVAMLVGVGALTVLAIRLALDRARDPLALPDHRRTLYVYLAELLVVLFFAHVRFNIPELFLAAAVKYWTFAVMGLAFGVVLLAEIFERRKLDVLAVPLRRTGVLLPLLPLLAFWAKPPAALTEFAAGQAPGLSPLLAYLDRLPQQFDAYAWLWSLAGGLYGLVALWRNSFGWALLAALSTNAAVWALLTHNNVPFALHPQAWVIPVALIVLVSEHVNRHRLRPELSTAMRYAGIGMIYVASSADMFLAGVGQSVWLPVILAVMCVLGVLAGIALRVRAFVFLGIGFLLLDVFAMIWHAAVDLDQTWVWYASGIVLGVAILTLFAVFEKRKAARGATEPSRE